MARYIVELLEKARLKATYQDDFYILRQMFENDQDHLFKNASSDGAFDVLDFQAFDIALKRLQGLVYTSPGETGEDVFNIIKFSRNNYEHAFTLFDSAFLANAYYLHLQTPLEICKERIRERSTHPVYEDDYPVSNFMFENYYYSDDGKDLPSILKKYGVDEQHLLTLSNVDSFEAIIPAIQKFTAATLLEESKKTNPQPVL